MKEFFSPLEVKSIKIPKNAKGKSAFSKLSFLSTETGQFCRMYPHIVDTNMVATVFGYKIFNILSATIFIFKVQQQWNLTMRKTQIRQCGELKIS